VTTVAVIGAGTMGGGIAQVAAQQGMDVLLLDAAADLVEAGQERIKGSLARAVERQRLSQTEADAALSRIQPARTYADLADVDLAIEAVVESPAVKEEIFRQLDGACKESAVLATNTSSLSITEIAAATKRPETVVGMHFFNPVPAMALVEVVRGARTAQSTVDAAVTFARQLGKTPVRAEDGPGFLVNRVARPFYTEALRIYSEGLADPAQIDEVMRGLGFRMGPFQLMDLIGNDVNLAVTTSIYEQLYHEPRFRPSFLQRRLVSSGNLGQKSGRGWYDYGANTSDPAPTRSADDLPSLGSVDIAVDAPLGRALASALQQAGISVRISDTHMKPEASWPSGPSQASARIDATCGSLEQKRAIIEVLNDGSDIPILALAMTASTTQMGAWIGDPSRLCGFGLISPVDQMSVVEVSPGLRTGPAALRAAQALAATLKKQPVLLSDGPGIVGPRILACLINEAAWAVTERIASPQDIDTAVKLGVNYPRGLLEWGDAIGVDVVYRVLEGLQRELQDDRYRPAPLLRQLTLSGWHGGVSGHGFFGTSGAEA
jgi:3-hydroxybutyryl-CoA dehydrogenase